MYEIRWHGRGGQGVVTAAKIFAMAVGAQGQYFQAFPEYGPERRGAPLQAFTRCDDCPIEIYNQIYFPDMVVVLDSKLIGKQPLADGLKEDGVFIANYPGTSQELKSEININNVKVYSINATDIAFETIGKSIPNTPMLGAAAKISKLISEDQLESQIDSYFHNKLKPALIKANIESARQGAEKVNVG